MMGRGELSLTIAHLFNLPPFLSAFAHDPDVKVVQRHREM